MASRPNTKPPTWAKYATPPPPPLGLVRPTAPKIACCANQMNRKRTAGSSMKVKKMMRKISVSTRARG